MRVYIMSLILSLCCLSGFAQRQQGIYVEVFGASTLVGIHYDSRFSKTSKFGGRIGIAYMKSSEKDFFSFGPDKVRGITVPMGLNYLFGNRIHNFELGVGTSPGIYYCKKEIDRKMYKGTCRGVFGFVDVGYRFQSKNGLMLRTGMNIGINYEDEEIYDYWQWDVQRDLVVYPYLSVGYAF